MSAISDSITDESGLFRLLYGRASQRSLQNVQQYKVASQHARRRILLWFAIAAFLLAGVIWRPWKSQSSVVAPVQEVSESVRQIQN